MRRDEAELEAVMAQLNLQLESVKRDEQSFQVSKQQLEREMQEFENLDEEFGADGDVAALVAEASSMCTTSLQPPQLETKLDSPRAA